MRDEIKLSVKMAREDDDANAQFPPLINYDGTVTPARKCPRYREAGPTHKPGWHRAPDLAMLKSRPVDPPRQRDYAKLTEAAKRKPVGWWGDERNIRDWSAFADPAKYEPLDTMPVVGDTVIFLDKGNTDVVESVLPNGSVIGKGGYCFLYEGFKTGVGRDGLPGGFNRVLKRAAPAPAPVADSTWPPELPVADSGIRCWFGHDECNQTSEIIEAIVEVDGVATYHNRDGESAESPYQGWDNQFPAALSEALAWLESHGHAQVAAELRAKERKNVAARAWRSDKCSPRPPKELRWAFLELGGQNFLRLWGGGWERAEKPRGGYGDGATEIHDPAEIQRLVAELHAAGLGK